MSIWLLRYQPSNRTSAIDNDIDTIPDTERPVTIMSIAMAIMGFQLSPWRRMPPRQRSAMKTPPARHMAHPAEPATTTPTLATATNFNGGRADALATPIAALYAPAADRSAARPTVTRGSYGVGSVIPAFVIATSHNVSKELDSAAAHRSHHQASSSSNRQAQ